MSLHMYMKAGDRAGFFFTCSAPYIFEAELDSDTEVHQFDDACCQLDANSS